MEKTYSDSWLGRYAVVPDGEDPIARAMRLSNIRKGVADFVRIVCKKDIPVRFSLGQQSYTDGEHVVVISASNNPKHLDSMVGLALHEGSHVLLSANWLEFMSVNRFRFMVMNDKMVKNARKLNRSENQMAKDFHLIMNFLEDRRIDTWMYDHAMGYRPYYEMMYRRYFYSKRITQRLKHPKFRKPYLRNYEMHLINMFSDEADPTALPGLDKIWRTVDLPNIRRYNDDPRWAGWQTKTRSVQRSLEPDIANLLLTVNGSVTGLHLPSMPLIVQDAVTILETVYENAELAQTDSNAPSQQPQCNNPQPSSNGTPQKVNIPIEVWDMFGEDSADEDVEDDLDNENDPDPDDAESGPESDDNLDVPNSSEGSEDGAEGGTTPKDESATEGESDEELSDEDVQDTLKDLEKQRKFTSGETEKTALDRDTQSLVDQLEAAGAEIRSVGEGDFQGAGKVVVYHKYDERVIGESYPFAPDARIYPESLQAVKDGMRIGSVLAHRIRVMADESTMKYSRQTHGRLDKRLVHELGFDSENVFATEFTVASKPVMVDLSVDSSGSMSGMKWKSALTLAVALAYAAHKNRKLRVRINLRTTDHTNIVVGIVYDSKEDNFSKITKLFKYLRPTGGTPEGLAFEAIRREILQHVKQTRRYFINLSDGLPEAHVYTLTGNSYSYGGRAAYKHTRKQVKEMVESGLRVLSYYITYSPSEAKAEGMKADPPFRQMYGSAATFIDVESVPEIAYTLNKLFMAE